MNAPMMSRAGRDAALAAVIVATLAASVSQGAGLTIGPGNVSPIYNYGTDYHIVVGTTITASDQTYAPFGAFAPAAVDLHGPSQLTVEGGSFTGGKMTGLNLNDPFAWLRGGSAMTLDRVVGEIQGGTFRGGDLVATGNFQLAVAGAALELRFSTMRIFSGLFRAGDTRAFGGQNSPTNFPPMADIFVGASDLHLHGGSVNYIILGVNSTLHIYGSNLERQGHSIYGELADGRPLNLLVSSDSFENVFLHQIPEPAASMLLWLAVPVTAVRSRRESC